ncbi:uncharacterized protein LOC133304983 [Gastrolobium bilobum]|uniref:uncharacterized protein LOC133304983 n=1 Tax=Gastrolobium bilobum TaxID=150636 RepID=UPI002AAF231F|nr:uncharacterized protein LOC133304983 [Gastrolobium bilobum]
MDDQNANAQTLTQNAPAGANGQRNWDGTRPNQNAQTIRGRAELGVYRRKYNRGQYNNSPFTREILNAPFLEDFDLTRLSKYDGSQDTQVHMDAFNMNMYIRGIDESLISRIFAITLTRAMQAWFSTLPSNSIGSFEEFGEKFKDAALQVPGLQENVHVHLIVAGLDGASRLAKSVYKDPVRTLEEFKTLSKKYLELEQMEITNVQSKDGKRMSSRSRSPTPREKERTGNKKKYSRSRIPDDRDRVGKYEKYTPLNASRSQIWREVAMTEMKRVDRPRPIFDRGGLDKSKYCAFHDGPGHNTDQC